MSVRFPCCLALFLTVLSLPPLAPVQAAGSSGCNLSFKQLSNLTASGGYDPFAGDVFQTERFSVRNNDDTPCSFAIGADNGENGNAQQRRMEDNGSTLSYELWTSPNRTQRLTDATGPLTGMMTGTVGGKDTVDFEFAWSIGSGQLAPAGDYRDRVQFTLYELTGGQPGRVHDTQDIQARAKVRSTASTTITINGVRQALSGARGTLDFGTLSAGVSRGFSLEVTGNASYTVTLESENGGTLNGPQASKVPYTLAVDGKGVSNPRSVNLSFSRSQTEHTVSVTIGEVGRALAGTYQDNLVLTVSSD